MTEASRRIAIAVPFRGRQPAREANWVRTRHYYERFGLPIFVSDSDPAKPFNLSQARNRAAAMAEPWDVLVCADADTLLADAALWNAVDCADQTGALVHPLRRYWKLDEQGNPPDEPSTAREGGGVHVWGRSAWDVLGGYDERFEHWGDEDFAVLFAAETFGLFHWLDGDAVHLWHRYELDWAPDSEFEDWVDVKDEFALLDIPPGQKRLMSPLALRYLRARRNPAAMRAILCEARLSSA